MTDHVQRLDPETGLYSLIEVASGRVVQQKPGIRQPGRPFAPPFPNVDEIELVEKAKRSAVQTDPLADFR